MTGQNEQCLALQLACTDARCMKQEQTPIRSPQGLLHWGVYFNVAAARLAAASETDIRELGCAERRLKALRMSGLEWSQRPIDMLGDASLLP